MTRGQAKQTTKVAGPLQVSLLSGGIELTRKVCYSCLAESPPTWKNIYVSAVFQYTIEAQKVAHWSQGKIFVRFPRQ